MLIKKRLSNFMLIRVRTAKRLGVIIPVPLLVLELTINAVADVVWFIGKVFFFLFNRQCSDKKNKCLFYVENVALITRMLYEFLCELRHIGRMRMVEVDNGKNRVYVDLY